MRKIFCDLCEKEIHSNDVLQLSITKETPDLINDKVRIKGIITPIELCEFCLQKTKDLLYTKENFKDRDMPA